MDVDVEVGEGRGEAGAGREQRGNSTKIMYALLVRQWLSPISVSVERKIK